MSTTEQDDPTGDAPRGERPRRRPWMRRQRVTPPPRPRTQPRYCPRCSAQMDVASEYWEGDARRSYCWCARCGWTGEVTTSA